VSPGDPHGPVVALGDSISCGPEEGAFDVAPRAWAHWLAEALDLPFHRLARPGALTTEIAADLVPRLRDDYALACVHVGTNDVRSVDWDAAAYDEALAGILAAVAARARRVCVATIPLDLGRPRAGAKVAELNAIVRRCAAPHGAAVVELADLRGWRLLFPDAVHPTALGQLEIAQRAALTLGISRDLAAFAGAQRGVTADLRYGTTRQIAHLARDWLRRWSERRSDH
jgi:lysophospholipase L1-like esterase